MRINNHVNSISRCSQPLAINGHRLRRPFRFSYYLFVIFIHVHNITHNASYDAVRMIKIHTRLDQNSYFYFGDENKNSSNQLTIFTEHVLAVLFMCYCQLIMDR